jgi:large subunit ribosomal protein L31
MRAGIHPEYADAVIHCTCGNEIQTRSTRKERMQIDVCDKCHPFYTGEQRIVDTAGRVERFNRRYSRPKS